MLTTEQTLKYEVYLKRTMVLLSTICAVSALLYGVFLLEAVIHTAGRSHAQHAAKDLSAKVSLLEEKLLAHTQTITKNEALAMGFVVPKDVNTVFASAKTPGLGYNTLQTRN